MELIYSNHSVNISLLKDRIIPYIMGTGNIDDLLEQAAKTALTRFEAMSWALAANDCLLKNNPALKDFNSELYIWGRPFFNVGQDLSEALEIHASYLEYAGSSIEGLARSMLPRLDTILRKNTSSIDLINGYNSLEDHIQHNELNQSNSLATIIDELEAPLNVLREVYQNLGKSRIMVPVDGEEQAMDPQELIMQALYESVKFSSEIHPGWVGKGNYWPTRLFEQINVNVSHIFERPTALFEPLLQEIPYLEAYLEETITENYSLGGFVPPEKMKLFLDTLEHHKEDLIFCWVDDSVKQNLTTETREKLSTPFRKIYEPAAYAHQNGYGFIEASNIYSMPEVS
ncbi:MAG: hypothetical protein ACRBBN_20555 [Methyloligellaceae bacterium]